MHKTRLANPICLTPRRTKFLLCSLALILLMSLAALAKERLHRMLDRSSGVPSESLSGYAQDTNGFFWISTAAGLYRFDGTEFRWWARDKLTGWHYMVYPSPDGEVFVYDLTHTLYHLLPNEDADTKGDKIGYVSAAAVASGQRVSCSLQALTGTRGLRKMIELPNGSIWVGTSDKGVWRYTDEEGWKPIPASLKQLSGRMDGFALSPVGGLWVLGLSARIRVIDRPDLADGWQVVEELSDWQGVPSALHDLIEEPDGSLWIASQSGVFICLRQ
jgi:hypothetical protein